VFGLGRECVRDFISLVILLALVNLSTRLRKTKSEYLSLRCIVELRGTNQTRNLKSMEVMVLRFYGMLPIS